MTECEPDHLVVNDRGAAAVARIDGGIDLEPQTGYRVSIAGEFDARNDALGNRETGSAGRITVNQNRILDQREQIGALQRWMRFEECFVFEPEHREIDAR